MLNKNEILKDYFAVIKNNKSYRTLAITSFSRPNCSWNILHLAPCSNNLLSCMPLGPNVLWVQVWTRAPELDSCMDNLGSHIQLRLHSLPREGWDLAGAVNKNKDLAVQLFLVMVYAGLTDRKAGGLLSWWHLLKCWGAWMSQRLVIASGTLPHKELIFPPQLLTLKYHVSGTCGLYDEILKGSCHCFCNKSPTYWTEGALVWFWGGLQWSRLLWDKTMVVKDPAHKCQEFLPVTGKSETVWGKRIAPGTGRLLFECQSSLKSGPEYFIKTCLWFGSLSSEQGNCNLLQAL